MKCVLALAILAVPLAAQHTTGRVHGTIRDQAGLPVAGARVRLVGTALFATSAADGRYRLAHVPIGAYEARVELEGFAPTEVRGIRVHGAGATTVDVVLQQAGAAIGPVATRADSAWLPRTRTGTRVLTGEEVRRQPVEDVRQAIVLAAGLTEAAGGLSIRGGRSVETGLYIDGAPVRGTNNGLQRILVGKSALEEVAVSTGPLGAEVGDARSGVISYTTRAGGPVYVGTFSYETDELFGDGTSVGWNRFEGSFGGPVPKVENLTLFASGLLQGQRSPFLGKGSDELPRFVPDGVDDVVPDTADDGTVTMVTLPRYVQFSGECGTLGSSGSPLALAIRDNYGADCRGRRLPFAWSTLVQLHGKMRYTYGGGSSISLTAMAQGDQGRDYPARAIGNPLLYSGWHAWQRLAVVNWSHEAFRATGRPLTISANLSWARDRLITGPLTSTSDLETRDPGLGIYLGTLDFNYHGFPFPIGEDIVRNIRANAGLRVPLLNRTELTNAQPFRLNPYGMRGGGWWTAGLAARGTLLSETRYTGRAVADWQATPRHLVTVGVEGKRTQLSFWSSAFLQQELMDAYVVNPTQYGVFASDRVQLGRGVIEAGLRWDQYTSDALFATTPGFTFTHPAWNPQAATDDTAYANSLARVFDNARGHSAVSPRVRAAVALGAHTDAWLSYSQHVQTAEFTTLLTAVNNDLSFTSFSEAFGRDLDFGKTAAFELGARHAFRADLVLDVSLYDRHHIRGAVVRLVPWVNPRSTSDTTTIATVTTTKFKGYRGADVRAEWRGAMVSASLAYSLELRPSLEPILPTPVSPAPRAGSGRAHALTAVVAFAAPGDWRDGTTLGAIARDLSAVAIFRAVSGLPYTRLANDGTGGTAPGPGFGRPAEDLDASRLPWTKYLDLKIAKRLRQHGWDVTAYADIRNALNWTNVLGLYAETGDVVNTKHRDLTLSPEFTALADEARLAGALNPDGSINLAVVSCSSWATPVNCEALRRVEARFGDGDGVYTVAEQTRALSTAYNDLFGPTRFHGAGRHVRLGIEVTF